MSNFEYDPIESSEAEAAGYCKLAFKPIPDQDVLSCDDLICFSICIAAIIAVVLHGRRKGGFLRRRQHLRTP